MRRRDVRRAVILAGVVGAASLALPAWGNSVGAVAPSAIVPTKVVWLDGVAAPGTPAKYNKVGILKFGRATAKNVLILDPGYGGGASNFAPLATRITATSPRWQVWSVERRSNLLEDHSRLNQYKAHSISTQQLFDYYLGYLTNPSITTHYHPLADSKYAFAKKWGLAVAVGDLRVVVKAAKKLGGKVVLGGHSLGGEQTTAYATWSFAGRAGAADLAGLVYLDGASSVTPLSAATATSELASLDAPASSPWGATAGIPAPYAGLFVASGAAAATQDPGAASVLQGSGLLPVALRAPVSATNLAQAAFAFSASTSPPTFASIQAHLGAGLAASGTPRGWDATGALSPPGRFFAMMEGKGFSSLDGSEWYFPQRLGLDTGVIANGIANPAQSVLGVKCTMGAKLPHSLRIFALMAGLFGTPGVASTQALAAQSGIPSGNVTIVDDHSTYSHLDPLAAYPTSDAYTGIKALLAKIAP